MTKFFAIITKEQSSSYRCLIFCRPSYQIVLYGGDADGTLPPLSLVDQVRVQIVGVGQGEGFAVLFVVNLRHRKTQTIRKDSQAAGADVVTGEMAGDRLAALKTQMFPFLNSVPHVLLIYSS